MALLKTTYTDWLATSPDPATDAAFLAYMAESVTETVETRLTAEELVARAGIDIARRVIDSLKAVAASDSVIELALERLKNSDAGLNAADPATAGMLTAFANNDQLPMTLTDLAAVAALTQRTRPRSQTLGLGIIGQPQLDRLRLDGEIE
jgi:hypothetical protein